jgi:hypothetical protein
MAKVMAFCVQSRMDIRSALIPRLGNMVAEKQKVNRKKLHIPIATKTTLMSCAMD